VDFDQFGQPPARDDELARDIGLAGAEVVGFLGSFYDYEGLDLSVEAAAKLKTRRPKLKILLVGGGPVENQLIAQIKRLDLSERIVLAGRVPQKETTRYYSLVDVLAYPRRRSRLTDLVTPLKQLEAMASGKLVVASDVGGHKELIEPDVTGTLFPAGSSDELARTIDLVFSHPERWPQMRTAGLEFVQRERNWENSVAQYEPVYRRLLACSK
jgi:glycosyltransferase involved in cell wall biosynthesis